MNPTAPTSRLPATFAALRHPNFRRWFAGQALSLAGTWMQSVAQGWLVYQLTGSEMALGAIIAAGSIPTLFLMLPAGAIADRMPKRRLVMLTQVVMMVNAFVLTALTWAGVLQVWQIGLLAAINGTANSFDAPARMALLPQMVEDRGDLQNAIAMGATMFNLARVVGPALGGLVLAGFGAGWCFAVNGLSFLAVLIALGGMDLPNDVARPPSNRHIIAEIGDGLRFVWQQSVVRTLTLSIAVTSIFGFSYSVLLPAYASDVLRVGATGFGLLNAAVGVGALSGALAVATLGRSQAKGLQLTIGSLGFPLAVLAFAATRSFPFALGFMACAGVSFVIQNATSHTIVQMLAPDELRGRVMSVYSLCFFGTMPVGAIFAGAAAERFGTTTAMVIGASVALVFALFVLIFVPVVRRTRL